MHRLIEVMLHELLLVHLVQLIGPLCLAEDNRAARVDPVTDTVDPHVAYERVQVDRALFRVKIGLFRLNLRLLLDDLRLCLVESLLVFVGHDAALFWRSYR